MRRSPKRQLNLVTSVIALIILALFTYFQQGLHNRKSLGKSQSTKNTSVQDSDEYSSFPATVKRVVDGDTFVCNLDNGVEERVRLIGVDTPESKRNQKAERDSRKTGESLDTIVALGKKSAEYTKSLLPAGTQVKLETDAQEKDKYGRILAYVYLPDGRMLNAILVQEGYAQVMTIPPNVRYQDKFLSLQREARENQKGLWKVTE
jgi:micrococcal nuclease